MNNKINTFKVTNYILDNVDNITNLRLQKLLFFCYGIYGCMYNEKLFSSKIYAWQYGPVITDVYHEFKNHGQSLITTRINIAKEENDLNIPNLVEKKDNNYIQAIKITLLYYNRFDNYKLIEQSHELDCWKDHINDKSKITHNEIIDDFENKIVNKVAKYIKDL